MLGQPINTLLVFKTVASLIFQIDMRTVHIEVNSPKSNELKRRTAIVGLFWDQHGSTESASLFISESEVFRSISNISFSFQIIDILIVRWSPQYLQCISIDYHIVIRQPRAVSFCGRSVGKQNLQLVSIDILPILKLAFRHFLKEPLRSKLSSRIT